MEHVNYIELMKRYANACIDKTIVAGELEILACKRFLADLEKKWQFVLDEARIDRVVRFFRICHHVKGPLAGQPIELEDWQIFDFGNLFGWVDKDTGIRRFSSAYLCKARGNAKSTEMSVLSCYGMTSDGYWVPGHPENKIYENSPQVVCVAVDKEQANIVWGDARDMALAAPKISESLKINKNSIQHITRGGGLYKLSRDVKNKDGGSPNLIIVDEYHDHPTDKVKTKVYYGKGKRAQSLGIIITTAGEDAENKPCKKEQDYAEKILRGEIEADSYYVMIRAMDVGDDPHDQKLWGKASPIIRSGSMYGKTLLREIKLSHDQAYSSGDQSQIREWLIKRANLWQVESEKKYFVGCMPEYKKQIIPFDKFIELTRGKHCYVGFDLGETRDLSGIGFVFPMPEGKLAIFSHGFLPGKRATEREANDKVPYRQWAKEGWVTLTEGTVTDYYYIEEFLVKCIKDYNWKIDYLCFDPHNSSHFVQTLKRRFSFTEDKYQLVSQRITSLNEPTKKFRTHAMSNKLIVSQNEALTWCIGNAYEICDNNGLIRLSKKDTNHPGRIDILAAVIDAIYMEVKLQEKEFVYARRGMISLS